jgi:hypothetical protein
LLPLKFIAFFRKESSVKKGEIAVSMMGGVDFAIISCQAMFALVSVFSQVVAKNGSNKLTFHVLCDQ